MLIGMVKRAARPAMVDGGLRSGVNGAGMIATVGMHSCGPLAAWAAFELRQR
jgi:hypothetical protein